MRLSVSFPILLLAAGLVVAQEKPAEAYEAAVIPVKTLSGDSFNRLVQLLNVFGAKYSGSEQLRTIVVYAPKDVVAQMRRVVEQLDRPGSEAAIGRNMEVTLAFLRCSIAPQADARPLPADLEPVAKQLRAVTQYKDIQLWDIVPLHSQEGREVGQTFRLPSPVAVAKGPSVITTVTMRPEAVIRKESGTYVRFAQVSISLKLPYVSTAFAGNTADKFPQQWNYMDVGLKTAGDFKEGQKTVLGKISGIDDESSVFVVVSLKVLD